MSQDLTNVKFDNDIYQIENFDKFQSIKSPKLALALSGGGARGFVNLGVIKALNEAGIYPDIIIGSSMGGIVSTLYGSGLNYQDIEEIVVTLPYSNLFDINLIPIYSVLQSQKLNYIIEKLLPYDQIEDFPINTALLNFDLGSGNKYIVSEGKVSKVLQSTYAIPFYYPISENKNRYLMDPGLVEMVPAKAAKALTADIILATTAFDELPYQSYRYPVQSLFRMLLLIQKKNAKPILENYADLIIENDVSDYDFKDFDLIEHFISIGYENTKKMMPEIKDLLKEKDYDLNKPRFEYTDIDRKYYDKLYTDILFERIIYPDQYFNYLLYYFNNQSFFEQDLFRNIAYDFHYGLYYEKSHLRFKTLFDVGDDRHSELLFRYKKLLDQLDLILRFKNNTRYTSIDYIAELKYYLNNSSLSLGTSTFNQSNYLYLNNNLKLKGNKVDFENNLDMLININEKTKLINSTQIKYNYSNRWSYLNKTVYKNTDLLGNPDIYRGFDNKNKEKTSISNSFNYRIPFKVSQNFLYLFSLEEITPSLFLDLELTDSINYATGVNINLVSAILGLKPLNLDLSTAYDFKNDRIISNFSIDIKF